MKVLLVAVNAKYIHSNLAVHTLAACARKEMPFDNFSNKKLSNGYSLKKFQKHFLFGQSIYAIKKEAANSWVFLFSENNIQNNSNYKSERCPRKTEDASTDCYAANTNSKNNRTDNKVLRIV